MRPTNKNNNTGQKKGKKSVNPKAKPEIEKKILVVTHKENIRKDIIQHLCIADKDFFPVGATDLSRVEKIIAEEPYQALICELKLPSGSGLEIIDRVREKFPRIPVIVIPDLEDLEQDKVEEELSRRHVHDIICKPLKLKYLEQSLRMSLMLIF